jgi:hypothetical protein
MVSHTECSTPNFALREQRRHTCPLWVKLRNTQTEYSNSEFPPTTDNDPGMVQRPHIKAIVTLENYCRGRSVESHAISYSRASPARKVRCHSATAKRQMRPFAQRYFDAAAPQDYRGRCAISRAA